MESDSFEQRKPGCFTLGKKEQAAQEKIYEPDETACTMDYGGWTKIGTEAQRLTCQHHSYVCRTYKSLKAFYVQF